MTNWTHASEAPGDLGHRALATKPTLCTVHVDYRVASDEVIPKLHGPLNTAPPVNAGGLLLRMRLG